MCRPMTGVVLLCRNVLGHIREVRRSHDRDLQSESRWRCDLKRVVIEINLHAIVRVARIRPAAIAGETSPIPHPSSKILIPRGNTCTTKKAICQWIEDCSLQSKSAPFAVGMSQDVIWFRAHSSLPFLQTNSGLVEPKCGVHFCALSRGKIRRNNILNPPVFNKSYLKYRGGFEGSDNPIYASRESPPIRM